MYSLERSSQRNHDKPSLTRSPMFMASLFGANVDGDGSVDATPDGASEGASEGAREAVGDDAAEDEAVAGL